MTLYQLTSDYEYVLDMLQDPTLEDPQIVWDTLESIEGDIEDKAEAYVIIRNELIAKKNQIVGEVKRLNEWWDMLSKHIIRMEKNLMSAMDVIGKKKIETEHFRIGIVGNGGKKPMRITADVPEEYKVMKPEVDTERIRQELEAGQELGFAHLEERGRHLSVR